MTATPMTQSLRPVEAQPPVAEPLFPFLPHVAGYGATRNMNIYVGRRIAAVNRRLKANGGLNPLGQPMYRVVWGWDRPHLYAIGGGKMTELYRLERWMDLTCYFTEDEWERNELGMARDFGSRYQIQPFPRHGDYMEVRTCQWGVKGEDGVRRPVFRMPDSPSGTDHQTWDEAALILDKARLARTRGDIAAEIVEDQAYLKQLQDEKNQAVADQFGIRDLAEDMTHRMIRNPTLRKNPDFMLSPAVGYKRVRHNIPSAI